MGGGEGLRVIPFAIVMSITLTLLCLSYAQTMGGMREGWNPRTRSGEGGERKGDWFCPLLEIHEIEKVGNYQRERINKLMQARLCRVGSLICA